MGENTVETPHPVLHVVQSAEGRRARAKRAWLYRLTTVALSAVVVGALIDAVGTYPLYGVDSEHVTARASGLELDVRYARVSRPAVATPFDVEVRRPGGFDGPVTLAVSSDYLTIWDENGLDPAPTKETGRRPRLGLNRRLRPSLATVR